MGNKYILLHPVADARDQAIKHFFNRVLRELCRDK